MERRKYNTWDIIFSLLFVGFYIMLTFNMSLIFIVIYVAVVIGAGVFLWAAKPKILNSINRQELHDDRRRRRLIALSHVKLFLTPYNDIWKNIRVANKLSILKLGSDGRLITAYERQDAYGGENKHRSFRVVSSGYTPEELWNLFCLYYDHQTSYEGLVELANRFGAKISESAPDNISVSLQAAGQNIPKTDVNNASEIELTALPGISIVLSKKIIKKREEIGGFKTLDDFFLYLRIKPHLEKQLRNLVCLNRMEGVTKIDLNHERNIDL